MTDTTTSPDSQQSASVSVSVSAPASPASSLSYKSIAILVAVLAVTLAFLTPLRNISLSKFVSRSPQTIRTMTTATNGSIAANGTSQSLKITKRPWNARGFADHGWLYTFHTFNFASYFSPNPLHESFGPLRVINEDRVEKGTGFGTHGHAEFLIFSYIVNGKLEHKDSLGNLEYLKRGEVQFTSAGTGIRHSEYNRDKEDDVHFLQIWAKPNIKGLKPHYCTREFPDEIKQDKFVRIMEYTDRVPNHPNKDTKYEPIGLQADLSMDASILSPGKSVEHEIVADGPRKVYLHVVMSGKKQPSTGGAKIKVGDTVLGEGDGAYVENVTGPGKITVESVGEKPAEFLLFDLAVDA